MSAQVNFNVSNKADWLSGTFSWTDSSNKPISLVGSTLEMQIRDGGDFPSLAMLASFGLKVLPEKCMKLSSSRAKKVLELAAVIQGLF
jgi:hypothetical protein